MSGSPGFSPGKKDLYTPPRVSIPPVRVWSGTLTTHGRVVLCARRGTRTVIPLSAASTLGISVPLRWRGTNFTTVRFGKHPQVMTST